MDTDIPLKELTLACAPDLLALLGSPGATVLEIASPELPAAATRLDTVLRLCSPQSTAYLHLVGWQGYRDPRFLQRVLFDVYVAWLLNQALPVLVTIVYLKPGDDTGDTFRLVLDGREYFSVPFHRVRLWWEDAATAIASGLPGLAVLSALMARAAAAGVVLRAEPDPAKQARLLGILGVFAEAFIAPEQLERILGRERLMESKLLTYLMREKTAEFEQQRTERERQLVEERLQGERQLAEERLQGKRVRATLWQVVEDTMIARFPTAPVALVTALRQVRDPDLLQQLHTTTLAAPDQVTAELAIREMAARRTARPGYGHVSDGVERRAARVALARRAGPQHTYAAVLTRSCASPSGCSISSQGWLAWVE